MHLLFVLTLAGLSTAAPNPLISARQSPVPRDTTTITADQAHANVLRNMDPSHVINSADLHDYLKANIGANHTIYVNDTMRFISLSQVKPKASKRQGEEDPCYDYTNYWAEQIQNWWNDWEPASSCLWTGLDPLPASQGISWSYSLSISENAGLSWTVIADVLSATAGITVTETWSNSGSYSCPVPAYSVGQIWLSNKIVWGWMWSEGCQSCDYGGGCGGQFGFDATANGGAQAPVAGTTENSKVQYGCSTGSSNVQC